MAHYEVDWRAHLYQATQINIDIQGYMPRRLPTCIIVMVIFEQSSNSFAQLPYFPGISILLLLSHLFWCHWLQLH